MARRGYHLHEIWNLLMLQLWYAIFIDESLAVESRWSAQELTEMSGSAPTV